MDAYCKAAHQDRKTVSDWVRETLNAAIARNE
jgi:hypothetical protein